MSAIFHEKELTMDVMHEIRSAFARRGNEGYGEGVSQLEHAIQWVE